MKIVIFGLTITSAWGNGHATTYRSLVKALTRRGHTVIFFEKDVEWYRGNRDLPTPDFCEVRLYESWEGSWHSLIESCVGADAIVVGSYFADAVLVTRQLLDRGCGPILFYDIDTPVTVSALRAAGRAEYLDLATIREYSAYLSFTGGPTLQEVMMQFGARRVEPFYCSVDPDLYKPSRPLTRYRCDLSYLGTYASDRQAGLMRLLDSAAANLPQQTFLVAGAMYPDDLRWSENVRRLTHVAPPEHAVFYSSSRFTLNLTRMDMIAAGYSPSVRLFEASACGTAILSDYWEGIEDFLTPGNEILLPGDEYEVTAILRDLSDAERTQLGRNARDRILAEHTSMHRAVQFEQIVSECSVDLKKVGKDLRATSGKERATQQQAARPSIFP